MMETTKITPISSSSEEEENIKQKNQTLLTDITAKYTSSSFVRWCKLYISLAPNTLQNILDTMENIVLDNHRMEIVDIPNMVLLIITTIHKEAIRYDIVSPEHILHFTKFILYTIIDYEFFHISPILKNNIVIEAMTNSCLELVQVNLEKTPSTSFPNSIHSPPPSPKKDFWNWIFRFFCFWK